MGVDKLICPVCGTENSPAAMRCRNCSEVLKEGSAKLTVTTPGDEKGKPPTGLTSPPQFSLGGLLLVITLIAVCLSLFVSAPGLGIFASIISLPPLIRTIMLSQHWKQQGYALSFSQKATAFVTSLVVTVSSLVLLAVVAAITFFFACLRAFSGGPGQNRERDITVIVCIGGALGVWALVFLFRAIRRRWHHDKSELPADV